MKVERAIRIIAKALIEQQKHGQVCPETMKKLNYMKEARISDDIKVVCNRRYKLKGGEKT